MCRYGRVLESNPMDVLLRMLASGRNPPVVVDLARHCGGDYERARRRGAALAAPLRLWGSPFPRCPIVASVHVHDSLIPTDKDSAWAFGRVGH